MRKLRVGFVGLGHVVQVGHLPGYKNIEIIDVVAGADIRMDVLNKVSSEWGFKGYTNFEEMLKKENLDIACVATGPRLSKDITEKVAEYGVNVLVEKPMALTLEDAKSMVAKCEKESVRLCYGETFRFLPTCRKAKEMTDDGLLGDLSLLMEIGVGGHGPERFQTYQIYPPGAAGAGEWGLTDHGIHLVDIFRWLTGDEVEWVFGRGNRAGQPPSTEYLTMMFKSGAIGQLIYNEATYPSEMPYEGVFSWGSYMAHGSSVWDRHPANFRAHGTKGALRIFTYPNKMFFFSEGTEEQIRVIDRPHPGHFGLQIEDFAKRLLSDKEPEATGIDGMRALQIILSAYDSFETHRVVRIEPAG